MSERNLFFRSFTIAVNTHIHVANGVYIPRLIRDRLFEVLVLFLAYAETAFSDPRDRDDIPPPACPNPPCPAAGLPMHRDRPDRVQFFTIDIPAYAVEISPRQKLLHLQFTMATTSPSWLHMEGLNARLQRWWTRELRNAGFRIRGSAYVGALLGGGPGIGNQYVEKTAIRYRRTIAGRTLESLAQGLCHGRAPAWGRFCAKIQRRVEELRRARDRAVSQQDRRRRRLAGRGA